jgi:hypothetical protein
MKRASGRELEISAKFLLTQKHLIYLTGISNREIRAKNRKIRAKMRRKAPSHLPLTLPAFTMAGCHANFTVC